MKIKDRIVLGTVAGLIGNSFKTLFDEISLKLKISQRSFRATAAGVWVSKEKEATNIKGQILGSIFDFGLASLGGIGIVHLLSKTGRDHIIVKGIVSGITIGSFITAMLSAFPQNKVKPKDAASNLSYVAAHAVYGIITTGLIAKIGDKLLFDSEPYNDHLSPTYPTTQQKYFHSEKSGYEPVKTHENTLS